MSSRRWPPRCWLCRSARREVSAAGLRRLAWLALLPLLVLAGGAVTASAGYGNGGGVRRPQAPAAISRHRRGGAPQRLWSRPFPDTAALRAYDGRLLVGPNGPGGAVVDPSDGRTVFDVDRRSLARVTGGLVVTARPEGEPDALNPRSKWTIDAWSLSTGEREWSLESSGRPGLGEVADGSFFYGDKAGIHRVAVPPGEPEERQTRSLPESFYFWPWPLVKAGRVYFNADMHRLYGLDASDLERGWWNYCDCRADFADEDGVYGAGTIGFTLAAIRTDGKAFWKVAPWRGKGGAYSPQFSRGDLYVSGEVMVAGGQDIRRRGAGDSVEVPSPYLYVLRKKTGELLWRKPMAARHPVIVDGRVVVWAGHRRVRNSDLSPYGIPGPALDWRLEVYDLVTGRLLWRGRPRRDHAPPLAVIGERFFVLEDGVLTAYR